MPDPKNIEIGSEIPSEGYCDQPYVVKLNDGGWLCLMTTGTGKEGDSGQHIVATRTYDRGQTWSTLVDIEPADGPEASWVMPLITPLGRVYAFYTYNAANMREVIADTDVYSEGKTSRVDTLGEYSFKYSDDDGLTWSERHTIPVREMEIDWRNPYGGDVRFSGVSVNRCRTAASHTSGSPRWDGSGTALWLSLKGASCGLTTS
ncbi:TPA: hypothetical protein DCE37_18730 [Candidatus Latescibacteria bacterium]|nr:hypothetical protein [Candidatus Latescibacterota bacterium]